MKRAEEKRKYGRRTETPSLFLASAVHFFEIDGQTTPPFLLSINVREIASKDRASASTMYSWVALSSSSRSTLATVAYLSSLPN